MISINKEEANINKEKTNMHKREMTINKEEISIAQDTIIIKKIIHHIIVKIIIKHHKEIDRGRKNIKDLVNVIEKNHQDKYQIDMIITDLLQKVVYIII